MKKKNFVQKLLHRLPHFKLTGVSTPFGGVSWEAEGSDREAAHRVIVFLDDRRVLYDHIRSETPDYAVESILEIRTKLTQELEHLRRESPLAQLLETMRRACRQFLQPSPPDLESLGDLAGDGGLSENGELDDRFPYSRFPFSFEMPHWSARLASLRRTFSSCIAEISERYHIPLGPELDDAVKSGRMATEQVRWGGFLDRGVKVHEENVELPPAEQ
jgi:hypothetical protein